MKPSPLLLAFLVVSVAAVDGCSKASTAPVAAAVDPAPMPTGTASAARLEQAAKACDLVTPKEMSAILGKPVTAQGEERPSNDETTCSYSFAGSLSPDVVFMLNRGDGEAAMSAMGMMAKHEPGIVDPYQGVGDQAATVGPQLWIRSGDDLVTLTLLGVDDVPAVAKRIVDTAKARM